MIKRILVALDPDSDTPVAIKFAEEIAARYRAEVVGLAVVDTEHIASDTRGGGIGSMYYAEKLRENLTEETRSRAAALIREFEEALAGSAIEHSNSVEEGVPFRRIVEDMKYHDLLVVGKEPHFFYQDPKHETETLARVVKETVAPTLVVGETHRPVRRVLLAYDGSEASARTMKSFVHLKPFGDEGLEVDVVNIHEGDDRESELMLRLAESYLKAHGFRTRVTSLSGGKPAKQISAHAQSTEADVVVAGAHAVSKLRKLAFGSTTANLIETCPRPLFLFH